MATLQGNIKISAKLTQTLKYTCEHIRFEKKNKKQKTPHKLITVTG